MLAELGVEIDWEFTVEEDDEGIGSYEFWGAKCYDSRPMVAVVVEGTATLPEVVEPFAETIQLQVDDGNDIDVEVSFDPVPGSDRVYTYYGVGSRPGKLVVEYPD